MTPRSKLLWPCLLLCGLAAMCCRGATYYVATNGDDTANGDIDHPWLTLSRCASANPWNVAGLGAGMKGGDAVLIRGGHYIGNTYAIRSYVTNEWTTNTTIGTAENPTMFKAYPGETVLISDITLSGGNPTFYAITLNYQSWWRFENITWSNCYKWGGLTGVTNIVFSNCVFTTCNATQDFQGLSFIAPCMSNKLQQCTFRGFGSLAEDCNDNGEHVGFATGTTNENSGWNLVEGCTFYHSAHDALGVGCPYNVIRSNLFINDPWIATNATCYLMGGVITQEVNIYGAYSGRHLKPGDGESTGWPLGQHDERNVYEWNTFLYTGSPSDDNGAFGLEVVQRLGIFRHNTIAFSLAAGVYLTAMSESNFSTSNTFYNNTIAWNGLAEIYGGVGMQSFTAGVDMNNSGNQFFESNSFLVNNIIWQNYPTNVSSDARSHQVWRTNWNGDYGLSNPLFTSTNGYGYTYNPTNLPDFHLLTNSPCIDVGTWLATITSDSGTGTNMTVDNSLYFSDGNKIVAGDTIQLQGSTNTATVIANDWTNNVLTLDSPLTWTNGQGVALAYNGTAPDMGAFETTSTQAPPPEPPSNLAVGVPKRMLLFP